MHKSARCGENLWSVPLSTSNFPPISSKKRKVHKSQRRLVKDLQFHFQTQVQKRGSVNSGSVPFRRQLNFGRFEAHPGSMWAVLFTHYIHFFFSFPFLFPLKSQMGARSRANTECHKGSCRQLCWGGEEQVHFCFSWPDRWPTREPAGRCGLHPWPGRSQLWHTSVPG